MGKGRLVPVSFPTDCSVYVDETTANQKRKEKGLNHLHVIEIEVTHEIVTMCHDMMSIEIRFEVELKLESEF